MGILYTMNIFWKDLIKCNFDDSINRFKYHYGIHERRQTVLSVHDDQVEGLLLLLNQIFVIQIFDMFWSCHFLVE